MQKGPILVSAQQYGQTPIDSDYVPVDSRLRDYVPVGQTGQTPISSDYVPIGQTGQTPISGQSRPYSSVCTEQQDHYGQCGGTCNGETFDPQEEIDVTKVVDSNCSVRWVCTNKGKSAACGFNPAPPSRPQVCERDVADNSCVQAPGGGQFACVSNLSLCTSVNQTFCEDTGANQSTIFLKTGGACDPSNGNRDANGCIFLFQPVSFQNHSCAGAPQPTQPPAPQPPAANNCFLCDNGSLRRAGMQSDCNGGVPVCPSIGGFNNACLSSADVTGWSCGLQSQPTQPPVPIPTQPARIVLIPLAPRGAPIINNNNPSITNDNRSSASTGSVNITVQQPQTPAFRQARVVLASGATTTTTTAESKVPVQTLPKTGLPFVAWSLAGLLPIGARLKKFGGLRQNQKDSPTYLWQKREFDKSDEV